MALVKCTQCGEEVSDKSNSCIHCGNPLKKLSVCPECNKKLSGSKCSNCGYEFESSKTNEDKKVTTTVIAGKNTKGTKLFYKILTPIVVIAIVIGIFMSVTDLFSILFGGSFKEYYNAKIEECPQKTLKEGLEYFANYVNVEVDYKIYEAKSKAGIDQVYLSVYGYYTPLTLENGIVSFGAMFNETNNTMETGNASLLDGLLCGN